MKKMIIALAVTAAIAPALVAAEGATVSGYNDITLMTNNNDGHVFSAMTEINFRSTVGSVTVGADIDFNLAPAGGSSNLEQAFFAYSATESLTIIGGLFNNPIGLEGNDSPDMATLQTTLAYQTLDAVTAAQGNNIAGLAAAYNAGVATVTAAVINSNTANDEIDSFALIINASPVEALDLELGYLSEGTDGGGSTGGSALNLNATYAMGAAGVSFEYMTADVFNDDIVALTGTFTVNDATSLAARYETQGDVTQASAAVWYNIDENLVLGAGFNSSDNGTDTNDDVGLEFIASF